MEKRTTLKLWSPVCYVKGKRTLMWGIMTSTKKLARELLIKSFTKGIRGKLKEEMLKEAKKYKIVKVRVQEI